MNQKISLLLFVLFLTASFTYALDYSVKVNSPTSVNAYEGDIISDKFSFIITNTAGICDISCNWVTSAGLSEDINVEHGGTEKKIIYFDVEADGSKGVTDYRLIITCDRIKSWNCWSSPDKKTYEGSFHYLWNGDGICTTDREKCANYFDGETNFLKDPSCKCSSSTKCNPSSERKDTNSRGCATFCGNGIKESKYEKCNTCPVDVGKCDGQFCNSKIECEGSYCVHNKCSHTKFIIGDTYCDKLTTKESCLNSPADCACSSTERCNSQGKCEIYCGNGICESSEQGICGSDCQWCGDGICNPNKETCKECSPDCGECEKTEQEEQASQQLIKITGAVEVSAQRIKNNKSIINIIIVSTLGLIILFIIAYLIYKKNNEKKSHKKSKHSQSLNKKCPKCNTNINDESKFCNGCGHKLK